MKTGKWEENQLKHNKTNILLTLSYHKAFIDGHSESA